MAILARDTANPGPVSHSEIRSMTGFSSSNMGKAVDLMLGHGLVSRLAGTDADCPHYQILWEKVDLSRSFKPKQGFSPAPGRPTLIQSERLKSYFTDTGFIDLLPHALAIARDLGYEEDEMIQAVCLVFDRQRTDPPVRNRTAWFRTVFKEKLGESRAQILAFRRAARM